MALGKQGGSSSASSKSKDIRSGITAKETRDAGNAGDVKFGGVPSGTKQNSKRPS